ncbi:hypothetical protein HAX54_043241 [Datura stramonium]|uniref:Disease resistance N-terminal domain-containing protein n=1 Tax=Datura stramonium TaxID=4076 RepID=A0ABS8SN56_DATST|nr:hypothetical protein [Datura stramonium]
MSVASYQLAIIEIVEYGGRYDAGMNLHKYYQFTEMEIGLAVGGAFLSSALNVLFDRLAPQGDLLKMFQKHKHHVRLLRKLKMTLVGLSAVLSDAENKQASNPHVSQWIDELRDAVDGAENFTEEVNYEALRFKDEGQHQNLAETSNQQICKCVDGREALKAIMRKRTCRDALVWGESIADNSQTERYNYLSNCKDCDSLPALGQLPLEILSIGRMHGITERLPRLTELSIYHDGSDEEIVSDENWELPSSIRRLHISNLKTLSSQAKSLTSLELLYIVNSTLAESALPSSLSVLAILHCPLLKPLLEFDKGEHWPNIAHISTIRIDEEYLMIK